MSYPEFSDFPPIPQRSAAEADFDTKMSALFQHFATTHRAEMIALIDFLKTGSTIIGGALNATTVGLDTPAAAKFTALLADSLGGDAVQASKSDATLGKLITVGSSLLSETDAALVSDLNEVKGFGARRFISAALNKPPGLNEGVVAILGQRDSARRFQIAFDAGARNLLALRGQDAASGAWRDWSEVYHADSILGTVSQSGGVPTGAIIERGSNANGEYVRYADGTQICWGEINAGSILSVGVGTFAEPYSTATFAWTFPASFIDLPNFSGSALAGTGSVYDRALDVHATSVNLTGASTINVIRKTGSAADVSPVAHLRAIGRWF